MTGRGKSFDPLNVVFSTQRARIKAKLKGYTRKVEDASWPLTLTTRDATGERQFNDVRVNRQGIV